MNRYAVGDYCPDTNNQYINIWDRVEQKNATWCHRNNVYDMIREMNKQAENDKSNRM